MGVRQHRHAVPRLPAGRRPAGRLREGRGRGHGRPLHRDREDRRAAHPVGRRSTTSARWPPSRGAWHPHRRHQLEHVPGRGLQARVAVATRRRPYGARRSTHIVALLRDRPSRPGSDIVKVWLADGTNYPGQDDFRARRRRLIDVVDRRSTRRSPTTPGWSSSTSSTSRPSTTPTCRTGASRCRSASTSASVPRSASTPATTRWPSTSSRSSRSSSRKVGSARST